MRVISFIATVTLFILACNPKSSEKKPTLDSVATSHFKIIDSLQYTIIEIKKPFVGADLTERYLLYPKNEKKPEHIKALHKIAVPVSRIAINSTTHLGYLLELGKSESVVAATNLNLYYDSTFIEKIKKKKVVSIGDRALNEEALIQQKVDVIFNFAIDGVAYKKTEQLRSLGQSVVLISEYMEENPLKKAEWIKVFARFFGAKSREKADSIYRVVKDNYELVKSNASKKERNPSVMIGLSWKGTWYVSGGNSFQARLIEDAGANYIWNTYKQEASIPLDIETVYENGISADFWINPGIGKSLTELEKQNPLFSRFKSFKEKKVFTNYLRSKPSGANDYWERGVVRPDLILRDLVNIFHAEESTTNRFYFYHQLEP